MKLYASLAFLALIIGMGLAFFLNHADKPIWLSLLAGIGTGLALYFFLGLVITSRENQ